MNELSSTGKGTIVEKVDQSVSAFRKIKSETHGWRLGRNKKITEGSSETPEISKAFKAIADHKVHTFLIVFVLL